MTTATKPTGTEPEIRSFKASELRAVKEGDKSKLIGYAAVFNSPSDDLGGFIETIKPGAFTRALKEKQDVKCVFDHAWAGTLLLGRTRSGTLKLWEDSHGLRFECDIPDTAGAKDVVTLIDRGDVYGCSFRFKVYTGGPNPGPTWVFMGDGSPDVRTLHDVDLFDVGPVTDPAYPKTDVALRSRDEAQEQGWSGRQTRPRPRSAKGLARAAGSRLDSFE